MENQIQLQLHQFFIINYNYIIGPSPDASHVNLAAAKHWQFMPNWKYGNTVELIIFRV